MRLHRIAEDQAPPLVLEWRAFPLRPEPDPTAAFRGTYREAAWRRCAEMAAPDGIRFTPWPHDRFPSWSLPALEAAECVARQGETAFARVHLRLYEAFFTESRDIADRAEVHRIVAEAGIDMDRFAADYASGAGREQALRDWRVAVEEHGVRAIPTVVFPATGRALVGLADAAQYRAALEEAARQGEAG